MRSSGVSVRAEASDESREVFRLLAKQLGRCGPEALHVRDVPVCHPCPEEVGASSLQLAIALLGGIIIGFVISLVVLRPGRSVTASSSTEPPLPNTSVSIPSSATTEYRSNSPYGAKGKPVKGRWVGPQAIADI